MNKVIEDKSRSEFPAEGSLTERRPALGLKEQISTKAAFFIGGVAVSAWAPLVPYAKARLGVDEGTLGLLLLCLGAGSIMTMPLAGVLAARFGCRKVVCVASLFICLALPFLTIAASIPAMVMTLLIFGASIGMVDVVINIQAAIVEKHSGRAMMSGFHGAWSVGGFAGAAGVSALLWANVSPMMAVLCVAVMIVGLLLIFGKYLLPYGSEDQNGVSFIIPKGIVLFIGFLCFIVFLAEGSILDWSAVFLTSSRGVAFSYAGLGYSIFSITMMIGRLTGDRIVAKFGGRKVVLFGGISAAAGLAIVVFIPNWIASLFGFALLGLGAANIVPVLYSVLGRQKVMPVNLAISAVSTFGYSGVLAGPALIGFIAHATSLVVAFLIVAVMLLFVAASSRVTAQL
ncbi:MFS transporter [Anaerosinus massiliensis]|uniref:MFS transporter n=1 Tax=Massilibacillus massiliensis TaxID=1806837 RepID=UPI000AC49CD9|nr:MFS transporter [Massilibacillus massiliensis]